MKKEQETQKGTKEEGFKEENLNEESKESLDSLVEIKNLKYEVDALKILFVDEKDKKLKALADLENFRRRMDQERATFGAITNRSLIQDILEIFDDMGMALTDSALDLEGAKSSIKNARNKLEASVAKAGVERIPVEVGDDFNKDIMEAISAIPDENNKGKVIAVITSAYKYANQQSILSSAKVIVGK